MKTPEKKTKKVFLKGFSQFIMFFTHFGPSFDIFVILILAFNWPYLGVDMRSKLMSKVMSKCTSSGCTAGVGEGGCKLMTGVALCGLGWHQLSSTQPYCTATA